MKVKIILLVLIFNIFLINGVLAESNVQNVTLEIHQLWDFSNEIDASVTETIYSNENWTYYDHICFDPNSEFINYFVYKDDFEIPEIRIYRPIIYESRLSDNPSTSPHIRAPFHEFQDFSEKIRFFYQKTHISPLFTTIFPNSPRFSTLF